MTEQTKLISGKSWINTIREYKLEKNDKFDDEYKYKLHITDAYEALVTYKLKTQLLAHQQRTVKAMIDLEERKYINITIPTSGFTYYNSIVETNAGIVSEKPGSGKTFEIFALIAETANTHKNVADIASILLPKNKSINSIKFKNRTTFTNEGFTYEVRKVYKKKFRQTLIFVGKSVLAQWAEKAILYTNFNVYIIENIFKLREFYDMIFNPNSKNNLKTLNKYDIILIKNGNIAGKFDVPELDDTSIQKNKNKPILSVFGELFKNYSWRRVVLDDFDTLTIPTNAITIPASFTWFISATKKNTTIKKTLPEYYNTKDILKNYRSAYSNIWKNKELFTIFNIGCDNKFIDNSTKASVIKYYIYTFINPNDNFIGMIGNMGQNNQSIAEMLNGDAINTAASIVGIRSNSVVDIFEKILDKSWDNYKKNLEIAKYILEVKNIINELPISDLPCDIDIAKNIKKLGPISEVQKIKYQQKYMHDIISDIELENNSKKDENGKAIQRVKDNIKQRECPISGEPLISCKGVLILKCCGITISLESSELIFTSISAKCPNCRAIINTSKIILIDRDLNNSSTMDKILCDDILESESNNSEIEDDSEPEDDILDKFNCIIKIIQGKNDELSEVCEVKNNILIPNLLEGSSDYGSVDINDKKIIIYTNYKETMIKLEKKLNNKCISYAKLHGTSKNIKEIHRRYWLDNNDDESISVILINGPKYCAGLDLQNTTDLIFAHKVIDKNIETQIAGRGARYGRKNNFHIHYVLYENEKAYMFDNRKTK